jgi:hypothetical protein
VLTVKEKIEMQESLINLKNPVSLTPPKTSSVDVVSELDIWVGRDGINYYLFSAKPEWLDLEGGFDAAGMALLIKNDDDLDAVPDCCRGLGHGECRQVWLRIL